MLLESTSVAIGPEELSALGSTFEDAWRTIAADYGDAESASATGARLRLATIVMDLAKDGNLGQDELKERSVRMMRSGA